MQVGTANTLNNLTPSGLFSNELFIRIGIAFIVLIIIIVVLLFTIKSIRKLIYKIFSQTSIGEFFIPLLILWDVLICEKIFKDLVLRKESSVNSFLNHFSYELLIIYIIYAIFFGSNIWGKIRNQSKKESQFWRHYRNELKNASGRISALNVRNYNLFSEPLGVRYFLEQIRVLSDPDRAGIVAQRIIVISATNREDILSSKEIKVLRNEDGLNDDQRNFYNVYLLHRLHNIKLFLAPKDEIMKKIKGLCWARKSKFHNLDRLLIDEKCWSPTNKGEHLVFEEDPDRKGSVDKIITEYAVDEYEIEQLRKDSKKT